MGLPVATAVKVAVAPETAVVLAGSVVNSGAACTVRTAALLTAGLPTPLLTVTV